LFQMQLLVSVDLSLFLLDLGPFALHFLEFLLVFHPDEFLFLF
jgi:hypothetical protein